MTRSANMLKSVAGKLALVTGAGSGIGREVCHVLAREGATVIATDQNTHSVDKTLQRMEGSGHTSMVVNVADTKSIDNAFNHIISTCPKPPTIAVNCAGITRDNFILKLTEEDFDAVLNVNLRGTFFVMQKAVRAMVEAGNTEGASIINIASIVGRKGNIGQSNYCISKAGVEILTKTAAKEFGKYGIRVNAVVPGIIKTPIIDTVPSKVMEKFMKETPLNRIGEPQEVAELVAFLASDKSSYINGTSIEITGGLS